jgi:hypothetical protein
VRTSWRLRNRALFVSLPEGNVLAVRGDWWVGDVGAYRVRRRWRKRVSHR